MTVSMKDMADDLDGDVEDLGFDPQPSQEETGETTPESSSKDVFTWFKDIFLSDTGHKPLESYNPEDYGLPDTQGSKRLIRATDVLLKNNLETVISDYIFGAYDLVKNVDKKPSGGGGSPEIDSEGGPWEQ